MASLAHVQAKKGARGPLCHRALPLAGTEPTRLAQQPGMILLCYEGDISYPVVTTTNVQWAMLPSSSNSGHGGAVATGHTPTPSHSFEYRHMGQKPGVKGRVPAAPP